VISVARRGLQQATDTFCLMGLLLTTDDARTASFVANRIRAGALAPAVSPFAPIQIISTSPTGAVSPQPVTTPAQNIPFVTTPTVQVPWTADCFVYSPCRPLPCAGDCNNGALRTHADFAGGHQPLFSSCLACAGSTTQSMYFFTSTACANSANQDAANACCRLVQQDAVCWAFSDAGVAASDLSSIEAGAWTYRPPSINSPVPVQPPLTDGPRTCPHKHKNSPKGLLGLLGLLGLIPLCICCLLLLCCFIRRKRREGDVHFATFDAGASVLPAAGPPLATFAPATLPVGVGGPLAPFDPAACGPLGPGFPVL